MQRLALLDSSPALRLRIDQYLKEQWPGAVIDLIDPTPEQLDAKRATWDAYDVLIIGFIEDAVAALDLVYRLRHQGSAPRIVYLATSQFQVRGAEAFLSLAAASLPRETLNRFDLRNALSTLVPGEEGNPLDTATRAITAHLKSLEAEAQQAPPAFLTTGPITAFPALAPRIAVLDSEYGSRTLIGLFLRQRWPNAVIDAIDPFTETMHGLHSIAAPDANLIIIGSIGSVAEAENVLAKIRMRPNRPGVILLISPELEPHARELARAGAHAVLLRDALSARDLIDASTRLVRQDGEQPPPDDPARAQLPLAGQRGLFSLMQGHRLETVAIERFRPLGKLAGNENNHVFYAERIRDHKRAVIKIMNGTPVDNRKALHSFIDLYVYLSAKEERSLVKVLDGGVAGPYPYMAFEYLQGGDLRRVMSEPLAPRDAMRICRMIAEALAVMHVDHLAHMDIKPENVFFRDDGSVVLIDFTLATRFGLVAGLRGVGEVMGTPFYMSPEQGQGLPIDGRSDFYSLGVLLFEMLTGQKPFQADSAATLLYKHIHDEIPLMPQRYRAWQPLVDRLLAKKPEDRFQNTRELLAAINAYGGLPD
jgi:eukaryotic-like serine/threonine-protein kinase